MNFAFLGEAMISPEQMDTAMRGHVYLWSPRGGRAVWGDYCAVFVFTKHASEISPETVAGWIGHPHLRVIAGESDGEQLASLARERSAVLRAEECERKFLVTFPDVGALEGSPFAERSHIVQTYLVSDAEISARVRMRDFGGVVSYTHTLKRRIDKETCEEEEREIDRAAYESLLLKADPERRPIEKTRWCILFAGQYFELDVYPFWGDRATVELETAERSDAPISFPSFFRVIREVTDDVRYKNARLAREVPFETI